MNKFNKICLFLMLLPLTMQAQSDPQISQHLLSKTHFNPAVTGASSYGNITLIGRHQFVGFSGAPATGLLNFDMLAPSINSGFGLSVVYDRFGPLISYNAMVNYAYHLKTGENQHLSFGLGAGIQVRQYDASGNIYENESDPTEYYDRDTQFAPTVNFGLEYNLKNWVIGASITNIQRYFMKNDLRFPNVNYYLYTRYRFELGRYWDLIPGIAAHYDNCTVNTELNLTVQYIKLFWLGVSYRMSDLFLAESIVPMVGFNITDFVRIGYAYDYNLTQLNQYSKGTHELLLTIRFKTKGDTYKTPRFAEW
jgi:type IX secretion system PorP/SprF family membrane protein